VHDAVSDVAPRFEESVEPSGDGQPGRPAVPELVVPAVAPARWRRRLWVSLLVLVFVALAGFGGAAGYLAWQNSERATLWQERAVRLEGNVVQLNSVLSDRSSTLNERTRELNTMAVKARAAQRALRRSESDVASLARRQRELANEKAQVEDARAAVAAEATALRGVASATIDCKNGVVELLGYVLNDDYDSASYSVDDVRADCDYAAETLQNYNSTYG
jgi:hypothetical protein